MAVCGRASLNSFQSAIFQFYGTSIPPDWNLKLSTAYSISVLSCVWPTWVRYSRKWANLYMHVYADQDVYPSLTPVVLWSSLSTKKESSENGFGRILRRHRLADVAGIALVIVLLAACIRAKMISSFWIMGGWWYAVASYRSYVSAITDLVELGFHHGKGDSSICSWPTLYSCTSWSNLTSPRRTRISRFYAWSRISIQ